MLVFITCLRKLIGDPMVDLVPEPDLFKSSVSRVVEQVKELDRCLVPVQDNNKTKMSEINF